MRAVRFSPDGHLMAMGGQDKIARVWRVRDGAEVARLEGTGEVTSLAFSPDGKSLAVADLSRFIPHVTLWNIGTGKVAGILECVTDTYTEHATALAWSPDARLLAVGANNGPIQLWGTDKLRPVALLMGNSSTTTSIVFLPDGQTLASACLGKTISLWDLRQLTTRK